MQVRYLILAICFAIAATLPAGFLVAAEQPDEASILYQQGDYANAIKSYEKQARAGETFARYRLSYMYAVGLGTKPDPVKSVAWAMLAEESGARGLADYRKAVAALVPEKNRRKAQRTTDTYRRRFDQQKSARGDCTGSRLSAACGGARTSGGRRIVWEEDLSEDPGQLELIKSMNESLLQETFGKSSASPAG